MYTSVKKKVAEIVKELTFLRPKYTIAGLDWQVDGDFWAHDYTISSHGEPIVKVYKEWISWGDSYAIDIRRDQDALLALAIVLAIDCVMDQQAVAASTS